MSVQIANDQGKLRENVKEANLNMWLPKLRLHNELHHIVTTAAC